jgi:hypothetical protein
MDALSTPRRFRSSRWSRDAVLKTGGSTITVYPTDRDIEVFKLLARFRYLPADYIHAFIGGNPKALTRRLNLLTRKPNLYLSRPAKQRQSAAANHRPLVYELDERGSRVLREQGFACPPHSPHNFTHALMVAQVMASIELGARQLPHVRLITWADILTNEKTPSNTRNARAAGVRVAIAINAQTQTMEVTADAKPFGLERTIAGARTYLFFPGIEADCATEPISATDFARSSIARKFMAYTEIARQGLYRSHFGFPNFFIPFITANAARMRSMMQLLDRMTDAQGSKMFLFKTFPTLTSTEAPRAATGHMLTEPWERVGFPPFFLDH